MKLISYLYKLYFFKFVKNIDNKLLRGLIIFAITFIILITCYISIISLSVIYLGMLITRKKYFLSLKYWIIKQNELIKFFIIIFIVFLVILIIISVILIYFLLFLIIGNKLEHRINDNWIQNKPKTTIILRHNKENKDLEVYNKTELPLKKYSR